MKKKALRLGIMLDKINGARICNDEAGKTSVVIPIEEADLYVTEKGHVSLALIAWPNDWDGYTLKQYHSLDYRETRGRSTTMNQPILGKMQLLQSPNAELVNDRDVPT